MRIGSLLSLVMICFFAAAYILAGFHENSADSLLVVDDHLLNEWGSRYPDIQQQREVYLQDDFLSDEEVRQLRHDYLVIKQGEQQLAGR